MTAMDRAKVSEWRIHIGAHKTATTHVQNALYRLRPELQQNGITFLPHDELRSRLGTVMRKSRWHYLLGNWSRRQIVQRRILGQESVNGRVLLSEENILGGALEILACHPYRGAHKRLEFVRSLARATPTTVYLSIRSFDRVLPGAFATGLSNRPAIALDARKNLITDLGEFMPSWVAVVEQIKRSLPNIPLRIWRQETYQYHPEFILSEFCGTPIETLPDIPTSRSNLTPSTAAVEEMERLFRDKSAEAESWKKRTKEICRSLPVGEDNPRYTFLSDSEIDRLQEQYNRDLEVIAQRWPEMMIEPQ